MTPPFIFEQNGADFEPSKLARSPWERGKQNGVALGGLLAHLLEQIPTETPMIITRLTIDILAAAPWTTVRGSTRIIRPGKRIQLAEAELLVEGVAVARATGLFVRVAETPAYGPASTYLSPEEVADRAFPDVPGFGGSIEVRQVFGAMRTPGPAAAWIRFGHEHVAGVPLSPLVRAATLGDFCSGLSSELPLEAWSYPNLDIVLHFARPPEGEWLLIDARSASAGNGSAQASAVLADRRGPFATAFQTLFISPRAP